MNNNTFNCNEISIIFFIRPMSFHPYTFMKQWTLQQHTKEISEHENLISI